MKFRIKIGDDTYKLSKIDSTSVKLLHKINLNAKIPYEALIGFTPGEIVSDHDLPDGGHLAVIEVFDKSGHFKKICNIVVSPAKIIIN